MTKLLLEHYEAFGDKQIVPAKVKNKAYTQMVRGKLFRKALRKLKDIPSAEDAVQQAFENALRYQAAFNTEREYDDWFGMILNNTIHDVAKENRFQGMSFEDVPEDELNELATEELFSEQERSSMIAALERVADLMPERQKAIIRMVLVHGNTPSDTSRICGVSPQYTHKVLRHFKDNCNDMDW